MTSRWINNGCILLRRSTVSSLSPPQRLPLDIPIKIAITKNRKRAGDDWKREKAGVSLLSSPFPSCPARSLFLSPQPPHNIKRSLRRREQCHGDVSSRERYIIFFTWWCRGFIANVIYDFHLLLFKEQCKCIKAWKRMFNFGSVSVFCTWVPLILFLKNLFPNSILLDLVLHQWGLARFINSISLMVSANILFGKNIT